jgi:hypothetical protein
MRIFRTETRHLIRKAIFVALLTVIALIANSRAPSFLLWLGYLLVVWFVGGSLTNLLRTHLKLSDLELQGWGNAEEVYARWSEIVYARREEEKPGKYWLVLATRDRTFAMPLELLDADSIWQIVQLRVPKEALSEAAADRLVKLQEEAWEKRVSALKPPFTLPVGRRFIWLLLLGVFGWGVTGLLSPLLLVPEWASRALICITVAILLTLAFFLSLVHTLHIEADTLTIRTITGHFRLRWDELQVVRADPSNSVVIFEGNGKRLVSAPYILGGFQKESAMEYITLRLRQKQISVTREPRLLVLPVASSKSAMVKVERKPRN